MGQRTGNEASWGRGLGMRLVHHSEFPPHSFHCGSPFGARGVHQHHQQASRGGLSVCSEQKGKVSGRARSLGIEEATRNIVAMESR